MDLRRKDPAGAAAGPALLAVVLVVFLVVPAVAGTAGGRPPPRELCAVCAELDHRDTVGAAPVVVEASATTIHVDDEGTGRWRTEVVLGRATATALAEDPELRRSLVTAAFDGSAAVESPRDLRSRMVDRTLVVEYRVPGMAHESAGGVLLVDFFYGHGDASRWYRLGADEVRLIGPAETGVTHAPSSASVEGNALTWRAPDDGWRLLGGAGFVAFAPDDGLVSRAATVLAVQVDVGQASLADVPVATGLPAGLLALVVGLLAVRGRWLLDRSAASRAAVAGGSALLLTLLALLAVDLAGSPVGLGLDDLVLGWLFVSVGTGAVLLAPVLPVLVAAQWLLATGWRPREDGPDPRAADEGATRSLRSLLVGAAVVVAGAGLLVSLATAAGGGSVFRGVLAALSLGPVTLFVPLGASERTGHPARHILRASVVAAPAVLAFAAGPFSGSAAGYLPLVLGPWAVLTGAVGVFAWPIGAGLADDDPARRRPEDTTTPTGD